MIIVKAGGSAITYKKKPYALNEDVMKNVASQLAQIDERVILVHGVGSFGHPLAKKYRIGSGYDGTREKLMGLMLTHYWVDELSPRFIKILIDNDVPALRCRPTTLFITKKGRIEDFYSEPIERFLEMGMIPVLHGDGPADREQGFAILSGDQITTFLARRFKARKVIFGMDVPGVLKDDKIIPEIKFEDIPDISKIVFDNHDASGGLGKKLEEVQKLADMNIKVQLVSLCDPDTLVRATKDQGIGTLIK